MTALEKVKLWLKENPKSACDDPSHKWPIGLECLLTPAHEWPEFRPQKKFIGVQSIWSKPYQLAGEKVSTNSKMFWPSRLAALCMWSYSALQLAKVCQNTVFFGDAESCELAKKLELPYGKIRQDLDFIDHCDSRLWATGKLYAMSLMERPYFHLDWDAVLFQPLPKRFETVDAFYQNWDYTSMLNSGLSRMYQQSLARMLPYFRGSFLEGVAEERFAWSMGIFGTRHPQEVAQACCEVTALMQSSPKYFRQKDLTGDMMVWEQASLHHLLSAKEDGIGTGPDFRTARYFGRINDRADAYKDGFCHFIAESKHNPNGVRTMLTSFKETYPEQYALCQKLAQGS